MIATFAAFSITEHEWLVKFIEHQIGSAHCAARQKWLNAGVLERWEADGVGQERRKAAAHRRSGERLSSSCSTSGSDGGGGRKPAAKL